MARNDGIDRTVARNQDIETADDLAKVQEHNEREKDSYSNQDIVPDRSSLNIHFKEPTAGYEEMFTQMEQDKVISTRGLKADAVKYGELVFDVNSAYFYNHGGYEFAKQFYADAYKAAVEVVGGEQYILSAVMHADERNRAMSEALGQDVYTQQAHFNGHYNHIDTINEVRRLGSIQAFVESGQVRNGIMYECVRHQVPFVLVGSVRDDGPLPEVYGDVYQGQDAMRELVRKATTIICMASTLHTVATGNMTPCYRVVDGQVRPLFFYSVDISEFAVNKLRDRGSLSVKTIVTNVQDFIVHVRKGVCPPEG